MSLTRDQILGHSDLPTRDVPVPEWGDGSTVRVRGLTSKARFDWAVMRDKALAGDGAPEPTAYLLALSAIDDDGKRVFSDQDADALGQLRGDVLDRVAGVIMDLSGLSETAGRDAEGNSGTAPSGGSPTDSPETSAAP